MFILFVVLSIVWCIGGIVWYIQEEEAMILVIGILLAVIFGLLGFDNFQEDSRETAIANKLDIPKSQIEFKNILGETTAITKDNTYKFTFKSFSSEIIKYEPEQENKDKDSDKGRKNKDNKGNKGNESKKNDAETVRKLVSEKLQLNLDEVVVTKDKNNLYTAITSSGKYVVETEENTVGIKAMVKQS
ncbi:hypothetical protein [Bacillus sp. NPDC094106]|uniref:hypothetical protein n=1 Tax=Bacillus sp. NPDC094106 TaxID=3363949 RepID=UPI0037F46BDC